MVLHDFAIAQVFLVLEFVHNFIAPLLGKVCRGTFKKCELISEKRNFKEPSSFKISCCQCLSFLVLEPGMGQAKSWQIMRNHGAESA